MNSGAESSRAATGKPQRPPQNGVKVSSEPAVFYTLDPWLGLVLVKDSNGMKVNPSRIVERIGLHPTVLGDGGKIKLRDRFHETVKGFRLVLKIILGRAYFAGQRKTGKEEIYYELRRSAIGGLAGVNFKQGSKEGVHAADSTPSQKGQQEQKGVQ